MCLVALVRTTTSHPTYLFFIRQIQQSQDWLPYGTHNCISADWIRAKPKCVVGVTLSQDPLSKVLPSPGDRRERPHKHSPSLSSTDPRKRYAPPYTHTYKRGPPQGPLPPHSSFLSPPAPFLRGGIRRNYFRRKSPYSLSSIGHRKERIFTFASGFSRKIG